MEYTTCIGKGILGLKASEFKVHFFQDGEHSQTIVTTAGGENERAIWDFSPGCERFARMGKLAKKAPQSASPSSRIIQNIRCRVVFWHPEHTPNLEGALLAIQITSHPLAIQAAAEGNGRRGRPG